VFFDPVQKDYMAIAAGTLDSPTGVDDHRADPRGERGGLLPDRRHHPQRLD
jgi:hypothetical protein